jgi:hypothetical protein
MNAATAYFKAFIDGQLDVLATHVVLIGVVVVAEISLAIGIWLESPKNKDFREWLGLFLVLGGCVLSVIATILLLVFDEGISRHQTADIEASRARTSCIEKAAAWRITQGIDWGAFRTELKRSPPRAVQLWFLKSDPEITALASNMVPSIVYAGWFVFAAQVTLAGNDATIAANPIGVLVMSIPWSPAEPNQDAKAFAAALGVAHIPHSLEAANPASVSTNELQSVFSNWKQGTPEPSVKVIIGSKGPPLIDGCVTANALPGQ